MNIQSANQIRAALMARGYSCRTWAIEKGYCPRTVQQYVRRFAPETNRLPQRKLAKEIMHELAITLDTQFNTGEHQ